MTSSHPCGRKWTGLAQAHCASCCWHFGSVAGFDRHRSSGDCRHPATVISRSGKRVFRAVEGPHGTTWVIDQDRVHPQHAKRLAEVEGAA